MKRSQDLLRSYEEGRLTLDGLFLNLLSLNKSEDLEMALDSLSPELLARLQAFVENQQPRARVFNGPRPKKENVRLVKEWLRSPANVGSAVRSVPGRT